MMHFLMYPGSWDMFVCFRGVIGTSRSDSDPRLRNTTKRVDWLGNTHRGHWVEFWEIMRLAFGPQVTTAQGTGFRKGLSPDHIRGVSAQPSVGMTLKQPPSRVDILPILGQGCATPSQWAGTECAFN